VHEGGWRGRPDIEQAPVLEGLDIVTAGRCAPSAPIRAFTVHTVLRQAPGRDGCRVRMQTIPASFATIKRELINDRAWPTRAGLHRAVFDYIEGWYHTRRLHSALGYLSPAEYESIHHNAARQAA